MARTYVPAYKGYITDVPQIWFKRTDGKVFHFDQISQANVTPQVNYTEVNGGWSLYPVAYLPAQSTMEMSFTSAQFSADLFALANDKTFNWKLTTIPHSEKAEFAQDAANKNKFTWAFNTIDHTTAEIPGHAEDDECVPAKYPGTEDLINDKVIKSIQIDGLKLTTAETPAAGEYKVVHDVGTEGKIKHTITIMLNDEDVAAITNANDVVDTRFDVYYEDFEWLEAIRVDNKRSAIGELVAKYPVYSAGDEQQAGGVKGYVLVRIFRCRATTMPGFDSSYKSAVSNQVTFSTLESDQKDGATYTVSFYDTASSTGADVHTA